MLDILFLLTGIWLGFWVFQSIIQIYQGKHDSVFFLLIVLFIFNGLPLLLDVFVGRPEYLRFPGYRLAQQDTTTGIIYCIYISAVPVFLWVFGRTKVSSVPENTNVDQYFRLLSRARLILYLLLVSPIPVVLFSPDPSLYLIYGWTTSELHGTAEALDYYGIVTLFTVLSLLSAFILITISRKINFPLLILVIPWMVAAIWINGKRNLTALAIVGLWYLLLRRGKFVKFDVVGSLVVFAVVLYGYSVIYQDTVRNIGSSSQDFQAVYENFRIDFGRDDRIKMTIFAELYPDKMQILEYRGQSLLFYASMYIPRTIWPEKPYPYSTYFTSALFLIPPRLLGWGMTTSWLEEAIANFSWFGLLLGPLLLAAICRIGDSRHNIIVGTLTIIVSSLFISVHLAAFAPIFILWIFLVMLYKPSSKVQDNRL